jgi:hypothetical protein
MNMYTALYILQATTVAYWNFDRPSGLFMAAYTAFTGFATWLSYEMWKENTEWGLQWKQWLEGEEEPSSSSSSPSSSMKDSMKQSMKGASAAASRMVGEE